MDTRRSKSEGSNPHAAGKHSSCIAEKERWVGDIKIQVCRDVYEPSDDTELLLEAMSRISFINPLIDVGPGTGIEAIYASRRGAETVAIDISWNACLNTMINASRSTLIHVVQGDTLTPLRRGACGTAVFNTPYLPVEDEVGGSEAWSGGEEGVEQALRFLEEAWRTGCRVLVIVTSTTANIEKIKEAAEQRGYSTSMAFTRHVFFETMTALVFRRDK